MPRPVEDLWTVMLAAGGSMRLGRPKQLVRWRGRPLIQHAADLAQALTPGRVVAVLGASPYRVRAALRHAGRGVRCVTNADWRAGMSVSLRKGLDALPARASAALVLVTDQPLVTRVDLERLVAAWSRHPHRAAAAEYSDRLGIPAILPRRLWRDVARAHGDVGAREVLRRPGARITTVGLPAAGVDIDTEEDLKALRG